MAQHEPVPEFGVHETHGILLRPENEIHASSKGLGWASVYASTQRERPYEDRFAAVDDHLVVLHLDGPVPVTRMLGRNQQRRVITPGGLFILPSEITPLSTLRVGELIQDVGFPKGVANIVTGYGASAGHRIASHPGIGKVSFTGSTATGRRIVEASAGNLKKLQLELGGKGANIVFGDADIPAAVAGSAFAIFHNQGQACIAGSRRLCTSPSRTNFSTGSSRLRSRSGLAIRSTAKPKWGR